jgi:hypothetical protein
MFEFAQTEVEEIRRLALDPTPANFQTIEAKLEGLAASLSRFLTDPDPLLREAPAARAFFEQLPVEMRRLRVLMHSPLAFYRGLDALRAAHFGSYERSGEMRSLELHPVSRTVLHL